MSDQEFDVRIARLEGRVETLSTVVDMQNRRLEAVERRMDALEHRVEQGFRELRTQIFWLGSIQITSLLAILAMAVKTGHLF
ncbi:hypothetical protein [Massilia sp. BJB1822]|uniref:hypothetical protein n=1 Tax=Massilia sp. BJB1822 TaxID=2744470 RepID=UPI0015949D57|nr:hypothetical protein [Massilia sp. BJB1822]NVE00271.1 hypothetical protein [Massilia sp. BJB1822]